jgi:hypothetical protein
MEPEKGAQQDVKEKGNLQAVFVPVSHLGELLQAVVWAGLGREEDSSPFLRFAFLFPFKYSQVKSKSVMGLKISPIKTNLHVLTYLNQKYSLFL